MYFSEDGDTAEIAPHQGANSATTNYFTFLIINFQLHAKNMNMSQCYIIKEPSFLLLLNSTHKKVLPTINGTFISGVHCYVYVLKSDQLITVSWDMTQ
jgi:hypothetical protein